MGILRFGVTGWLACRLTRAGGGRASGAWGLGFRA